MDRLPNTGPEQYDRYPKPESVEIDWKSETSEDGICLAKKNDRYFYLRADGTRTGTDTYDWAAGFYDGVAWIRNGGVECLIDTDGKRLTALTIKEHYSFEDGICRVKASDGKYYFIKMDGTQLVDFGFESANDFYRGRAIVRIGGRRCALGLDGSLSDI
jgi:hypothetical protein